MKRRPLTTLLNITALIALATTPCSAERKKGDCPKKNKQLSEAVGGTDKGTRSAGEKSNRRSGSGGKSGGRLDRVFQDKNGDGKITKDELPKRMQKRFEKMDKNKDGSLDKTEQKAAKRRMSERRKKK